MRKPEGIILVDDNSTTNFLNSKIIEKWSEDVSVVVFMDSQLALKEIIGKYENNLVFVDLNMPVMDGWELVDELSKTDFPTKNTVAILTSSIDDRDIKKAESHEAVATFLSKPLSFEILDQLTEQYFQ